MSTATMVLEPPATDFEYRQKTYALEDTAGQAEALREDGFALIPNVLSQDEIAELRAAIDRLPYDPNNPNPTDWMACAFNYEKTFLDYIDRPYIVDLAEATMGETCHIIGESAWRSRPGHNGWQPHTDRVFFELPEDIAMDPRVEIPIYLCTAHYYLTDVTLDLAPTWVIPGSHKSGQRLPWGAIPDPEFQGRKLEPVVCKAGDVLFFRCELWHTGSENKTDQTRYLLQVHYGRRWVAQHFQGPFPFQWNPEILAAANERQLRLLGKHKVEAYG